MSLSIPSNRRKGKPDIENAGVRIQESGVRGQNPESRIQEPGVRIQNPGVRMQKGFHISNHQGLRTQDAEVG
jgi:hypothetical protein